jgi:hypothetical protein
MENPEKAEPRFFCDVCDYFTSDRKDYNRNLSTAKHNRLINTNKKPEKAEPGESSHFICDCGRKYKHAPSLYNHRKKCSIYQDCANIMLPTPEIDPTVLLNIVKQNEEFKNLLIEQNTKILEQNQQIMELAKTNKTIINNTNNNTNNFNLTVFLNEHCKDALNLTEFVNSLKLSVSDLEETGKLGFVGGISRIFINGLKELDMYTRPLHCTDLKRETVYIKDKDTWEKDDTQKSKMNKAIKKVANKNLLLLSEWQKQNPNYENLDSKEHDEYYNMSIQSLGAYSKEEQEKQDEKILRNVLKEVVLEKQKVSS